jgi:GT2 family glycosyltransferase
MRESSDTDTTPLPRDAVASGRGIHGYYLGWKEGRLRRRYRRLFEVSCDGRDAAPHISVIIPVFNRVELSLACLDALHGHASRWPYEVIVVDDGSSDLTQRLLSTLPGIRYCRSDENQGFVAACNHGAQQARGEFLVFLNNDTVVQSGWLDALRETFERWPAAGLVGSKLVLPSGRLQECGSLLYRDGSAANYGRGDDPDDPRYGFVREADYVSGAAMMIRRDLFVRLGAFDERYAPAYYEDTDLAMRVRAAGCHVLVNPDAVVIHREGGTAGTDLDAGVKRYQAINQVKFLERWRDALSAYPEREAVSQGRPPSLGRRGGATRVLTLFLRHGTHKYAGALDDLDALFTRQMPGIERQTIVIDNALPADHEARIGSHVLLIGGDNSAWDFSAWDKAVARAGHDLDRFDLVHLVTSAFRTLYVRYLDVIDERMLASVAVRAAALGHIDYYAEPVQLFSYPPSQHWLRTSFVFLPPAELRTLGSLVSVGGGARSRIFSGDPAHPFCAAAPLSPKYQEYILGWLTGEGTGQGTEWHTRFQLSADTLPFFEDKTLTILNEHLLALRLRAQGCHLVDVLWAATQLERRSELPARLPPWSVQLAERGVDAAPTKDLAC